MTEQQRTALFFIVIGYTGLLLVGLAAMRFGGEDVTGYFLAFAGFLFMSSFIRFVEKELELKGTKALWIIKGLFIVTFIVLAVWLYL